MLHPATVALLAPAKINLALRIVRRRDDGYHLLESLFLPLCWGDTVRVRVQRARGREICCDCSPDATLSGTGNLAARAARAYLDARELEARVEIRIEKRIWVAAGLGGGSSDAAAVLRALRALDPQPLALDALARLALDLGADVPFFLDPQPARISGIGEIRAPFATPALELLLVNPQRPLSTARVFASVGLSLGQALENKGRRRLLPESLADARDAARWVENDLEAAAEALCPTIGALRSALLQSGALAAGLSGSGPTLFGLFPTGAAAARSARELETKSKCLLVRCRSACNLTPR